MLMVSCIVVYYNIYTAVEGQKAVWVAVSMRVIKSGFGLRDYSQPALEYFCQCHLIYLISFDPCSYTSLHFGAYFMLWMSV